MSAACTNVAEWVLSGGRPDAPAILHGSRTTSYAALRGMAEGIGARLLDQGLARGDRVALLAENGEVFAAAYLGVIRSGLCVVPLQVDLADQRLDDVLWDTGARCLLTTDRFAARGAAMAARRGIGAQRLVPEEIQPPRAPLPPFEVDPRRDLAAIMLTSGSTGQPKGVMVTHRNIECNTLDILDYMRLGPDDRVMVVLPFYYCYGASLLHTHLAAGASLVINNRFMFPEKVLDEIDQRQCTGLAGVPSTYQILLRKTRFTQRRFPSLRWLQQAGGRLADAYIREIRRALPDVRLFVMYGQTEATARLSYLPPERLDDKLGSIGRGLRSTRLEVLRGDGTPVVPGSDEVGEIVATGENVTAGYWNDPEETAQYFRRGRLHTGDMARVDREGFIHIVERAREFIKTMGNRVSPREIEDVLAELPEVVEAAVVGVPDEILGEAPHAFVVPARPGALTVEAIRAYCLRRLPNYKIPADVEFVARLPKLSNGKIARGALRAEAASIRQRRAGSDPSRRAPAAAEPGGETSGAPGGEPGG